eukprot:1804931-Rhodomonas_salina.1
MAQCRRPLLKLKSGSHLPSTHVSHHDHDQNHDDDHHHGLTVVPDGADPGGELTSARLDCTVLRASTAAARAAHRQTRSFLSPARKCVCAASVCIHAAGLLNTRGVYLGVCMEP